MITGAARPCRDKTSATGQTRLEGGSVAARNSSDKRSTAARSKIELAAKATIAIATSNADFSIVGFPEMMAQA